MASDDKGTEQHEVSESKFIDERITQFANMTEEEKEEMNCDEIFCLYLRTMSKVVNGNFYKTVLRFIFLYRSCLNSFAFDRRRDHYKRADMSSEDHKLNSLIAANKED
jgi:hypothetical protein